MGITCALCHSSVDDSFAAGIGKRLDGWPNRDLNVGAIVALSPDLTPVTGLLGVDEPTLRKVLASWGPGPRRRCGVSWNARWPRMRAYRVAEVRP